MKAVITFFTQMDKQAVRAIGVTLLMFFLVFTLIGYGRAYIGVSESDVQDWFSVVRDTAWALPLTILVFCVAAFIGAPQWALIAGAVLAFGPTQGALYAWISTMISATLDFVIGRAVGADRLQRFGGALVNRMTALVRRNGFFTSFMVRFVPTGPFVLVNMAAGVSHMKVSGFLWGTGLGIIPKILLVAFVGQGMLEAFAGDSRRFVLLIIPAVLLVLTLMLWMRSRLSRRAQLTPPDLPKKHDKTQF